ncbi:MAG: hypothetical protein LC799_01150, partial [Actinobacteria bacterium]|nr:hypothetical protein [Actinomycetota bacterium]
MPSASNFGFAVLIEFFDSRTEVVQVDDAIPGILALTAEIQRRERTDGIRLVLTERVAQTATRCFGAWAEVSLRRPFFCGVEGRRRNVDGHSRHLGGDSLRNPVLHSPR